MRCFSFILLSLVVANSSVASDKPVVVGHAKGKFEAGSLLFKDEFENLANWVVQIQEREGFAPAKVVARNNSLDCKLPGRGCTVWFKRKLPTRVAITYDVRCPTPIPAVKGLQPRDINNFWMANDPVDRDGGLFDPDRYTGRFDSYGKIQGYYASTGGGGPIGNRTTRMRIYPREIDGKAAEHLALKDKDEMPGYLITPDRRMNVQLVAYDDLVQYIVNGKLIYELSAGSDVQVEGRDRDDRKVMTESTYDSDRFPVYREGFFGFRMVGTHHVYTNFRVFELEPAETAVERDVWTIETQNDWETATAAFSELDLSAGMATPTADSATFRSTLKTFDKKRTAKSITISQSPEWLDWEPTSNLGPANLGDAPVMLSLGPDNYWMFGRYRKSNKKTFKPEPVTLDGFDIPLQTTPFPNQFDAQGGLKKRTGGYHAWQSKDMINWVHHGAITNSIGKWMTTAEWADGNAYFYYDFPNDQDPHLYIDMDLFDGEPGTNMGIAYEDPSHGSDCGIIRDLDGRFHLILEDWSPINARTHGWDSPLAAHAVSADGKSNFKLLDPPVDHRTKPTGETKTYKHPHWVKENPERFKSNVAEYKVHKPAQDAFGDWAAISIGGQYYLFGDHHSPVNPMSVAWFTSSNINEPFKFCGNIGKGHPDPDICFAEGRFYLATQQQTDFVSDGPWVGKVEVRVGVDIDDDGLTDDWTDWQTVKETYDYIPGFAKQVARKAAHLELSGMPAGFGFQFEIKLTDTNTNESKPVLDKVELQF